MRLKKVKEKMNAKGALVILYKSEEKTWTIWTDDDHLVLNKKIMLMKMPCVVGYFSDQIYQ